MRQVTRFDPAPSRLRYRLQRMMLTPLYRAVLRVGLPVALVIGGGALWSADAANRALVIQRWADLRAQIEERPEFMVKLMAIDGASEAVADDIREVLPIDFPISSFDLDLEAMRDTVAGLAPVKSARLRVRQGGVLQLEVEERMPAVLWRRADALDILDDEGVTIGPAARRGAHPDLAVMAGDGADAAVDEALALFEAAAPIAPRLRGLVRQGERRWDVVLDRGQRIMLPERGAVQALERAIAMGEAVDMLDRDLVAVDLRLPERPTLRMTDFALEEFWRIKAITAGEH